MALNADLNGRMMNWDRKMVRTIPTVPALKRAWVAQRYAQAVYLAGLKRCMEVARDAVRAAWIDEVRDHGDYIVGTGGKQEGVWFLNLIQSHSIGKFAQKIPKSARVAELWNGGALWEGIYLAGCRRGWELAHSYLFDQDGGDFRQSWVQRQPFPA